MSEAATTNDASAAAAIPRYPDEPARWDGETLDRLLLWAPEQSASDVWIVANEPIWMRRHGVWGTITERRMDPYEIELCLRHMVPQGQPMASVQASQPLNFAHQVRADRHTRYRYRVSATGIAIRGTTSARIALRPIANVPLPLDEHGIEDGLASHLVPDDGLTLVAGVMGSGKTTLLASVIRHIHELYPRAIATYEAPIEYSYRDIPGRGPITQSAIPEHLPSWNEAARNITRSAADVVLFGETRDRETTENVIHAAQTGVALYTTLHAYSVAGTFQRVLGMFPPQERSTHAINLLGILRVVIYQQLRPCPQGGRTAIREFLVIDENRRDTLMQCDPTELPVAVQRMVDEHGQPLVRDARAKHAEGRIDAATLRQIEYERARQDKTAMRSEDT